jgi:hypothetical protein
VNGPNCGVENFPLCPIKEEGTSGCLLCYKHVSLEIIVTKKGEEKKKFKLVNKSTSMSDLIEHLNPTFNILFRV